MKKLLSCLLAAVLLLSMVSCVGTSYKTDVAVDELAINASPKLIGGVVYRAAAANYFDDYFDMPDGIEDFTVRITGDTGNLDEFGIFHVPAGREKEMTGLLQGYLAARLERNEEFYNSYIPEEVVKLRSAEVKVFGSYIVYAILSDDNSTILFSAIEEALTA